MLIEQFDLVPHAKKPFRELSGGLKRRVMLARAMINDPKLLILDEPTAGVDVELRRDLWRYLQELNRDGKTILLTSHYLEEVERLCRTIAIVAKGKIVRQGPKEEFVHEPGGLEAAYLSGDRRGARSRGGAGMSNARRRIINWIGLWTIIRREWSRLMRVPIQAFLAPWISALLFIFIFGFVVGGRIALIGGHHYIEFVLPGVVDDEHRQRRLPAVDLADLFLALPALHGGDAGLAALLCGDDRGHRSAVVVVRSVITALGILVIGVAFGATSHRQHLPSSCSGSCRCR